MTDLEVEIKHLIIESLDLEDIGPDDIETDAPLFNDGLGLDSIDALELGMALQQKFKVSIDAEDESTREHFRSVKNLAAFVSSNGVAVSGEADA
jgi:acyl carrier protein